MEQYLIKILCLTAIGPSRIYTVELDGFQVGKLGSRSELNIYTQPGNHTLSFKFCGNVEKTVMVDIPENQYITLINAKLNTWSGKIELEMGNFSQISNNFSQNNGTYSYNSLKTQVPKNGLGPAVIVPLVVVSLFFLFIFFILLSSDSDKEKVIDTADKTGNVKESVSSAREELTDEEKAVSELEKATEKFSDGRYRDALEICKGIEENYPDTETAKNMSTYINEQYAQFPNFTATEIMAEYEENIVNADEEYTDKVVIVTGTVSEIDKLDSSQPCVLLQSGKYFAAVQLNFSTSQTEVVSALRKGDSIKVIGKCTGKSGTYMLIFDGDNVILSDCLLIE